jgi:uncharacterized membrane protein
VRILVNVSLFAVFGLFFAYDVWEGIGNFLGVENQAVQLGLGITTLGWVIMYANVFLPAVVWIALATTLIVVVVRRMRAGAIIPVWRFAVLLTLGLLITAAISADLVLGVPAGAIFDTGTAG